MEQEQQNLFGLNVDQTIKNHLYETAKWGRFLAIVGFIMCVIIILSGIVTAANYNSMTDSYRSYSRYSDRSTLQGIGIGTAITYIIMAVLYFFPCLFLLRFSNQMKTALIADDQATLTTSFQNLKVLFRFVGILTIIFLALFILLLLAALMSA